MWLFPMSGRRVSPAVSQPAPGIVSEDLLVKNKAFFIRAGRDLTQRDGFAVAAGR